MTCLQLVEPRRQLLVALRWYWVRFPERLLLPAVLVLFRVTRESAHAFSFRPLLFRDYPLKVCKGSRTRHWPSAVPVCILQPFTLHGSLARLLSAWPTHQPSRFREAFVGWAPSGLNGDVRSGFPKRCNVPPDLDCIHLTGARFLCGHPLDGSLGIRENWDPLRSCVSSYS